MARTSAAVKTISLSSLVEWPLVRLGAQTGTRHFLAGSIRESNHLWMNSKLQAKFVAASKARA
jgi:hypothetical protein